MATHRCAPRGGHWNFNGVHRLRIHLAKTVAASSRACDVRPDRCLCIDPWRAKPDSSRNHVACNYQRVGVWWSVCLVFLLQTKRGGLFSRIEEPMTLTARRAVATTYLIDK